MATTEAGAYAPSIGAASGEAVVRTMTNRTNKSRVDYSDNEKSSKADNWKLMPDVKEYQRHGKEDELKDRRLGVTWTNLTVKGVGADAAFNENALSQFNIPQKIREGRGAASLKTIIDNSHGCVKPGEMLLVLGRPGAGCTTLLKMLANHRDGYADVSGDVFFGSMDHKQAGQYRGQIVMNTEDELFFPTLTVGQTMDFATRLKVPFHLPSGTSSPETYQQEFRDFLLNSMGISHTTDTKVGNEFVRGVSGGERKRVSIIETLATRGSVYCWDNSTRGLDASTALEYTRAVRAMTDVLGFSSIVTLYQAGNGIYNLFDKVLILDEGKEIFYGPRESARPYMESLGFICDDAANVADFLTGVTVPTERRIQPGFESIFPRTADAIRTEYEKTDIKMKMEKAYDFPKRDTTIKDTEEFKAAIKWDQHKSLPKKSPLTVSFMTQVKACVKRQYQIIWGDKATFIIKQASTLAQALIAGSLFYNAPNNSAGLFIKGGAIFFSLLFNSLLAMSEVTDSFSGRPVLAKHKSFALFHPAAFCIAQIAADIPVLLFQVSHFSIVLYFMVGLERSASVFFTYWIIVWTTTMCMTALFRAIGAAFSTFDGASKVSGLFVSLFIMYTGYMIPKPNMKPWFVWVYWIDPLAYGFSALLSNEFHDKTIPCVYTNLIPNGPGYTDLAYQSCAGVPGAIQGETSVSGDDYLAALSYGHQYMWRNFGIVWAWWALYVAITIIATCNWKSSGSGSGYLLIPRENAKKTAHVVNDEEAQVSEKVPGSSSATTINGGDNIDDQLVRNTSVFTWKNLTYTVPTPSGDRVLLDNVQGWVKPGMLGALMGSSGAGKTTLLDVLAQRKTDGTIKGSIMVDGRPLTVSFQRSAGYCEQLDVHEPLSTVREALEFSALLRQSRDVPREEKLKYVDTIINLLEMHDIEHTLIGSPGAGLSIEQRKRLTIGVELVSKPSILIFLDEPTSGLDGQAAFNTVRFLRKLADVGQAVLVTIHQPSAQLFAQFDTLLLLARGGKTVYFGDIGEGARTIKQYFGRNGAPCPEESNPAEHMIDVVSGTLSQGKDWNEVWLKSPEYDFTVTELDRIINNAAAKEPGTKDDGHEFAMPLWDQIKLVSHRMNVALYRNNDYTNNKFALHVSSALVNGFSFWKIGNTVADLQLRLFTVFNFIFVAPGVINQLQPLFIDRRDIYETREKKSKMYSWIAFVTALIVSELPYLCICAVLYFVCWYYTVGFSSASSHSGATFFVMLMYEFVYTGIGQFIAAYAPNAVFASLANPVVIGVLVSFCGVLVPYAQINVFWRYWMYYLNPFNYLMGSILTFTIYDAEVKCSSEEFALFDTPNNQTCAEYLADYLVGEGVSTNLVNPDATSGCRVCQYTTGADYLATLNLAHYYDGWRDAAIVVIFAISSYAMVYLLMKLRTKASKKAE
jgi:ATP-binding cassette subfamily G (WHITE) protein 2 (SNQ2)